MLPTAFGQALDIDVVQLASFAMGIPHLVLLLLLLLLALNGANSIYSRA